MHFASSRPEVARLVGLWEVVPPPNTAPNLSSACGRACAPDAETQTDIELPCLAPRLTKH